MNLRLRPVRLISLVVATLLAVECSSGQDNPWRVVVASGESLRDCLLDSLSGGVLHVTCRRTPRSIPINAISQLERYRESHFFLGAVLGTLSGALVGGVIASATYPEPKNDGGGLGELLVSLDKDAAVTRGIGFGAVGGLLLGGMIGGSPAFDNGTYDLRGTSDNTKLQIIESLLIRVKN